MRDLIFRGRDSMTGEWIVSRGIRQPEGTVSLWVTGKGWTPVDPATVGQYTGVDDVLGTRIFEGDILEGHLDAQFPQNVTRVIVRWNWALGAWVIKQRGRDEDLMEADAGDVFTVVGTVHDAGLRLIEGEDNA